MNGIEWLVVLGGVAAIAWVNWYFFVAARGAGAASLGDRQGARKEQ